MGFCEYLFTNLTDLCNFLLRIVTISLLFLKSNYYQHFLFTMLCRFLSIFPFISIHSPPCLCPRMLTHNNRLPVPLTSSWIWLVGRVTEVGRRQNERSGYLFPWFPLFRSGLVGSPSCYERPQWLPCGSTHDFLCFPFPLFSVSLSLFWNVSPFPHCFRPLGMSGIIITCDFLDACLNLFK